MSLPRYAARRDANEIPITRVFQAAGCFVQPLNEKGVPDLLINYLGRWHLVELKVDNAGLTEDQEKWWTKAEAAGAHRLIVRSEAHARKALTMWAREFADQSKREAECGY